VALPVDDTDLETNYTAGEVADVAVIDAALVEQTGFGQYAIHQYKDFAAGIQGNFVWIGQTSSSFPIVLQIFNHNTGLWETLDTNVAPPIDTDFVLTGYIPVLTNYKDGQGLTSCRIYQLGEV
jgi:hypothetical protein